MKKKIKETIESFNADCSKNILWIYGSEENGVKMGSGAFFNELYEFFK